MDIMKKLILQMKREQMDKDNAFYEYRIRSRIEKAELKGETND